MSTDHSDHIDRLVESSAHWGTFLAEVSADGRLLGVRPHADDPDAAPAIANALGANTSPARVARPAVRRAWLENGPGPDERRGNANDAYVELEWDEALDLAAVELDRVRREAGNEAIFGGSYGWASAGRFHHAQSQLHRFLNSIGGYTRSVNDYSRGASLVLLPHLIGAQGAQELRTRPVSWRHITEHTELLVSFGGVRRSNTWVVPGGQNRHRGTGFIREATASTRIVSISAQRDDAPIGSPPRSSDTAAGRPGTSDTDRVNAAGAAEWIPAMPATDTAVILALIHVLITENLADLDFLERYTVGHRDVCRYVRGESDGTPKDPEWAQAISRVPAARIRSLAREMAAVRTVVNVVYSLQRSEHGEQPIFAALTLAAFLGQIGLPGGGFTHGFGSMGDYGVGSEPVRAPFLPQGENRVDSFIPCARISDMLLQPGEEYPYDCGVHRYPEITLAYWAGGNPFHHHQDLHKLRRAFARLDTFIVNETHWTATAKHADIVFPVASTLERDDIVAGSGDARLRVSRRAVTPYGSAREEFTIFSELASRLAADFDEGRDSHGWMRMLYERWRAAPGAPPVPDFDTFWADGGAELPQVPYEDAVFTAFRRNPAAHPLQTPSGRIELYCETFARAGHPDAPPHASWIPPRNWWRAPLAEHCDLHLICNQPSHRLHSQQDMGAASQATKVAGREAIRLHPTDAASRGLRAGDIARVSSPQGSLLAGVALTEAVMPGVAQMHTGAWFDGSAPEVAGCINGSVNVLTVDVGTSALAQASSGAGVLVRVEPYRGPVPPVIAYQPPAGIATPAATPMHAND